MQGHCCVTEPHLSGAQFPLDWFTVFKVHVHLNIRYKDNKYCYLQSLSLSLWPCPSPYPQTLSLCLFSSELFLFGLLR